MTPDTILPRSLYKYLRRALARLNANPGVETRWTLGRSLAGVAGLGPGMQAPSWPEIAAALQPGHPHLAAELRQCYTFYAAFPYRSHIPLALEWGHFRQLLRVRSPYARDYYTAEAAAAHWKVNELARQIRALTYDRLLLHRRPGLSPLEAWTPEAVLKDPYVFEFLPLRSGEAFSEKQLEDVLMAHLPRFLLELGRDFAFLARQKRIHAGKNYFADLLFYHLSLRSYIIIDLKADPLSYADIGQMDLYVRLCERFWRSSQDNPCIGLILCPEKSRTLETYSLLNGNRQIWASTYAFTFKPSLHL